MGLVVVKGSFCCEEVVLLLRSRVVVKGSFCYEGFVLL